MRLTFLLDKRMIMCMNPSISLVPGPKSPCVECLSDGKKIASVIIDCTTLPIQNSNTNTSDDFLCQFPEFQAIYQAIYAACEFDAFVSSEFDLSNLVNGNGLDQVNSCMCYARPAYGGFFGAGESAPYPVTDFGGNPSGGYFSSALLTNIGTLQTVPLNYIGCGYYSGGMSSFISFPFLGGKHTRVRFFKPVSELEIDLGVCYGKYQLQFTNFDIAVVGIPTQF